MEDEIELVGWTDHDGHVWQKEQHAHNFFGPIGKPYSLRPTYAVKCGERHFDENGEEA